MGRYLERRHVYEVLSSILGGASPKKNNKNMRAVENCFSILTKGINRQISKAKKTADLVAKWLSVRETDQLQMQVVGTNPRKAKLSKPIKKSHGEICSDFVLNLEFMLLLTLNFDTF